MHELGEASGAESGGENAPDLNLKSFLPNFAIVNRAKDSDPKMAWALCEPIRAGEIVVFDKAYVDFAHLHHLHHRGVIWVTRAKDNMGTSINIFLTEIPIVSV